MMSSPVVSSLDPASTRSGAVWAALEPILGGASMHILDVGGGTGGFAVPLAQRGHTVTVVDPSPDALALLASRAAAAGVAEAIRGVQGDGDRLADVVAPASADLVLCHHVLEFVDDPRSAASAVAACLRPRGWVSLLAANQSGAVLSRALNGRADEALALLREHPDPSVGGRQRRFDIETLTTLMTQAGLAVEQWHGVRVVVDLLPAAENGADNQAAVRELEALLAQRSPYRDLATDLHLLCRRG